VLKNDLIVSKKNPAEQKGGGKLCRFFESLLI